MSRAPYENDSAYWETVARHKAIYADALLKHNHSPEQICPLCSGTDGDARCMQCGCSDGWPGCQCDDGPIYGPCVESNPSGQDCVITAATDELPSWAFDDDGNEIVPERNEDT